MAHWKARVELLLSVFELLFLSLTVEALQGKMCQNSLPSGGGRSLGAKISGGSGRPYANVLIPLERQLIVLQLAADIFTACHNARIASDVLATAILSVRLSVCHMPVLCQNDGT